MFLQEIEPRSFGCSATRLAGVAYVRITLSKFSYVAALGFSLEIVVYFYSVQTVGPTKMRYPQIICTDPSNAFL